MESNRYAFMRSAMRAVGNGFVVSALVSSMLMWAGCEGGGGGGGGDRGGDEVTPEMPATFVPGQSIGSINLGDSFATVKEKLGAPSEVRPDQTSGGTWVEYDQFGLSLVFDDTAAAGLGDGDSVDNIFATDKAPTVPRYAYEGITFGVDQAAAEAVFGPAGNFSSDKIRWWWPRGINLVFLDSGMHMIHVFPPIGGLSISAEQMQQRQQTRLQQMIERSNPDGL